MLVSYDIVTAFGVSALVSFVLFTGLLLLLATMSGLLRASKGHLEGALAKQIVTEKLLRDVAMPAPSAPEPTPHSERRLLERQNCSN